MIEYATSVFVTFLVIIDPLGMLPLFIALTRRQSKAQRRSTALRSTATAATTLLVVAVSGDAALRRLGIGLPAFRIAGGLLLLLLSIDMVFARQSGLRSTTEAESEEAQGSADVAVFPLAIPLIAGPGAMTSIMLLMGRAEGNLARQAVVIGLMLGVLGLNLATFMLAGLLTRRLGVTGINVVTRVLGIVLAALAIQYMVDGLTAILLTAPGILGR
jgi:MarC family membrane protein